MEARVKKLTNDPQIGINGKHRTPMDSLKSVPTSIYLSWVCQELLLNVEFEQGIWLSESDGTDGQALNEKVRQVEIRSLRQVLGQE